VLGRYGFAALTIVLATLLKMGLSSLLQEESPFLLFFFAILLSAWIGGRGPGLLATGLASLSANYFFFAPYYSFAIEDISQVLRTAVFLVEGVLISLVVSALRSARQRAEDSVSELRSSEERFRRLTEEAVEGLVLSEKGVVFDANPSFTRMFGYGPGEVIGMNAIEFVPPEDREMVTQRILAGDAEPYESRGLRKDGTVFPIEVRPRRLPYRGREVRVTSVLDTTERKRTEEALRFLAESSATLSSSLDYRETLAGLARLSVPYLADWCAVDTIEKDGSLSRLAVAHEDPEKVKLARALQERYPPDVDAPYGAPSVLRTGRSELVPEIPESLLDEAAVDEKHPELLRQLELKSYMIVPLVARGRTLGAITFVSAESGRRYGTDDLVMAEELARRAAMAVDNARLYEEAQKEVSERKKVERAWREGEERFRLLIESIKDYALIMLDPGGRIVSWNEGAERIKGYREEEVIGEHFSLFYTEEDVERGFPQEELRIAAEEGRFEDEGWRARKDGSRFWANVVITEVRDESGELRGFSKVSRDITERKSAEEELRRQRDLYEGVLNAQSEVGEGLVIAEGPRISFANEAFCEISGYDLGELQSIPSFFELFPSEERSLFRERFMRRVSGEGGQDHQEIAILRKDGRRVELEIAVKMLPEEDLARFVVIARDITARKRDEEALRRSERSLADAQRIAHVGNWEYFVRKDEALWSDELYRIFGLDRQGFVPTYKGFLERAHPEDRGLLRRAVRKALRGAEPVGSVGYRIVRPDGEVRYVESQYEVSRDARGRPEVFNGTVQDVTERKRAEERLREAEARFRTLVEQIPAVTYVRSANAGRSVIYVSPQVEEMLGYSPEEILDNELWRATVHPDDRERLLEEIRSARRAGEPIKQEYRQIARDGREVWVRDEAVLVRDEDGWPLFWQGVQFDVTEQKRAREELDKLVDELRRSNTELEQFAYVASHDLQEPLRMVSSYTQLLARRYKGRLDADADDFIEYAVDGANRMQRLISDLLAYSRLGTRGKELRPTDLSAVFEAARANLKAAIEESGAEVTAGPLPVVMGDATQLVQLLQNLMGNALKFNRGEHPKVRLGAERRGGGEWVISVSDNGIGIELQYLERIFVIFQRLHTREEHAGTGIGLAVCKKIVERHGGRIWVESEPGAGSTFYFTLREGEGIE
jgi:PAS domain S-box-containing protein